MVPSLAAVIPAVAGNVQPEKVGAAPETHVAVFEYCWLKVIVPVPEEAQVGVKALVVP